MDISDMLRQEKERLEKRIEAINAFLESEGITVRKGKRRGKFSAEHRAKISAAAKRRWSLVKKEKKAKPQQ